MSNRYSVEFHGTAGTWFVHDTQKSNICFGQELMNGVIHADEIAEQLNEKDVTIATLTAERDAARERVGLLEAALTEIKATRIDDAESWQDYSRIIYGIFDTCDALLAPAPQPAPGPEAAPELTDIQFRALWQKVNETDATIEEIGAYRVELDRRAKLLMANDDKHGVDQREGKRNG
jgi:hypothetical protein